MGCWYFTRCPSEKQKHNEHKHTVSQKLQGQNQEVPRTDDATMVTRIKFARLQNHWTSESLDPLGNHKSHRRNLSHSITQGHSSFSDCRPELEAQAGPSPRHGAQIFSHLHPTEVQSQVGLGSNGTKPTQRCFLHGPDTITPRTRRYNQLHGARDFLQKIDLDRGGLWEM